MKNEKWEKKLWPSTKLKILSWITENGKAITPTTVWMAIQASTLEHLRIPSWYISEQLGGLSEEEEEKIEDEKWEKSLKRMNALAPFLRVEMQKLYNSPNRKLSQAGMQYLKEKSLLLNSEETTEGTDFAVSAKKRAKIYDEAMKL